jgi:hypothetical protein
LVTFVALYRGRTFRSAKLIALSTDPDLAATTARSLALKAKSEEPAGDPVISAFDAGRRDALRLLAEARRE